MPDPAFEIRGGGKGGSHPDPYIKGGGRSPKKFFPPLEPANQHMPAVKKRRQTSKRFMNTPEILN